MKCACVWSVYRLRLTLKLSSALNMSADPMRGERSAVVGSTGEGCGHNHAM